MIQPHDNATLLEIPSGLFVCVRGRDNAVAMPKMIQYNKLVRHKVPELIRGKGEKVEFRPVKNDEEYWKLLKQKLIEEANEFQKDESIDELTDLIEVLYAICAHQGVRKEDLIRVRKERKERRGGYEQRVYLVAAQEFDKKESV
ncbi:phosphoribosyl-ATP pyrophosphohydrolase [Candidatus Uhrbacteria bacterium]|nr:phosphoribosyl-ATP pyrophosphohydrolase [Candidatus Uhrbacteria bacterium]